MTLTEFRYIIAVARELNFGKAAQQCNVSQPTLSIAIKKLEDELGVAIFERSKSEIRVSPLGEMIVQQAMEAVEAADAVKQVAQSGKDQLAGPLRIGAIYTIGPYIFPELITRLHKAAPEMPLIVEENYTSVLTDKLKRGELDVIIVALPFEEQGIVTQKLYEEPFVVLLPASHPLNDRKTIKADQLSEENVLLLGQGHCFRDHVIESCPSCASNNEVSRSIAGSSLETIRHMVASGLGVTVLPCTAAGAHNYSQRLLKIKRFSGKAPSRTVVLAWRVTYPRTRVIDVINDAVRDSNLGCVKFVSKNR